MVDKHLYIADLDGTLLKDNRTLSKYSHSTLKRLIDEKEMQFTIATARSYTYAKQVLGGLDLKIPLVLKNGAVTTDFESGRNISVNYIEDEYWRELVDDIGEYMLSPFMSSLRDYEEFYYYDHVVGDGMQWYVNEMQAGRTSAYGACPAYTLLSLMKKYYQYRL